MTFITYLRHIDTYEIVFSSNKYQLRYLQLFPIVEYFTLKTEKYSPSITFFAEMLYTINRVNCPVRSNQMALVWWNVFIRK